MQSKLAFPVKSPLLKPQVEQYFYECRDVHCPDETFHYAVWLPHEWRPVGGLAERPDREMSSVLASFKPAAGPEAELTVTVIPLIREMAPAHWLDLFLQAADEVIVDRRTVDGAGGPVADVLSRRESAQGVVISRWLVLKDYNRLFLLHAQCLEAHYASHALVFFMALTSFRLLHPVGWPLAEDLRSFSRRLPGDFCLFYPASWTVRQDPSSCEQALEVHLINQASKTVQGDMTVVALSLEAAHDPQRLANRFVEHLCSKGHAMPSIPLAPAEPTGGFSATWQGQGLADTMACYVTVGRRPDAWFLLALLSPAREANGMAWAINKRAYDVLLDRFRTPTAEQVAGA